jgi:CIC family chloride channel protein
VAAVGSAAGISAAFNTPIAGITFIVEEHLQRLSKKNVWLFSLAPVFASAVMRAMLGSHKLLHVTEAEEWHSSNGAAAHHFVLAVLVGVIGGTAVAFFMRSFFCVRGVLRRREWLHSRLLLPLVSLLCACLCGVVFNTTGLTGSWGIGKDIIHHITDQVMVQPQRLALVLACRVLAVFACAAAGGPGGLLLPSLEIGALIGALLQMLVGSVFGEGDITVGAVFGMCALFAGLFRCPVTSVIILYEVTGIYSLVLPALFCSCIAFLVSSNFEPESFYHRQARESVYALEELDLNSPKWWMGSPSDVDGQTERDRFEGGPDSLEDIGSEMGSVMPSIPSISVLQGYIGQPKPKRPSVSKLEP